MTPGTHRQQHREDSGQQQQQSAHQQTQEAVYSQDSTQVSVIPQEPLNSKLFTVRPSDVKTLF